MKRTSRKSHLFRYLIVLLVMVLVGGCKSTFELKSVDYTMLLETTLTPDEQGNVSDRGYGLKFSVRPIQFLEKGDSTTLNSEYRLIRDVGGYYFITSAGFNHVYVFKPAPNAFELHKKIVVVQNGLVKPAFNQRKPNIQLVDGDSLTFILNNQGLIGGN